MGSWDTGWFFVGLDMRGGYLVLGYWIDVRDMPKQMPKKINIDNQHVTINSELTFFHFSEICFVFRKISIISVMPNNNPYHIFIVDDDPWYSEFLSYHLSLNPDYKVSTFHSGKSCLQHIAQQPQLITIDFSLPDMYGDELFKSIQEFNKDIPVIVISSQEEIQVAVQLLKMGVKDYLVKDEHTQDILWNSIIRIRETQQLKEEVQQLKEELGKKLSFKHALLGQSEGIQQVVKLMEKASQTSINVSITGETGTGKEVVAKSIHYNSSRKKKKIVAVNMSAIPKELAESELFGHEKGAFTGALTRKPGKFEEAQGGTLFLDEIAEMDLSLQSKLLRVLQEREVVRIGGQDTITLDVRLIVATHKNLLQEVEKGNFREDLYYRIMGLPIHLPPLRERGHDILLLAKHFLDEFCSSNNLPTTTLSPEASQQLLHYSFPGNVRELKAMLELAAVLCSNACIEPNDLHWNTSAKAKQLKQLSAQGTLKEQIAEIIQHQLNANQGDVLKTAEQLDIGKSRIYQMLEKGEIKK